MFLMVLIRHRLLSFPFSTLRAASVSPSLPFGTFKFINTHRWLVTSRSVSQWKMSTIRNKRIREIEGTSHRYSSTSKRQPIKKNSGQKPKQRPIDKNVISKPVIPGLKNRLERFFSQYSEFRYKPERSSVTEFNRLCKKYRWKKDDPEKDAARREFNLALKDEFDSLYGSDNKDINNWLKLCHVLRIDPVPDTLKECRAVVLRKHVNLVDLVEGSRQNIRLFKSEKKLSEYTIETGKFFPKEDAADGGVLRDLRRHIWEPRDDY